MATVAELLGVTAPRIVENNLAPELPHVGGIGIELELEGAERWPEVNGWRQEADGSLRDGIEYVFNGAKAGRAAVSAIQRMDEALRQVQPNPSFRCSTHVHIDVRDMDMSKVELMVLAYIMHEGVLFDHCAPDRRYSNFCVPFFVNHQLARVFTNQFHLAADDYARFHAMSNWPKYSALNIKPITNYGSLEFRGSHALTSGDELLGLAQRVLHLKRVAAGFDGTPLHFVHHLREEGVRGVFQTGLRDGYEPDEELLDQGYASALGVAAGVLRGRGLNLGRPMAQRPVDPEVLIDLDAMERYNLFPVRTMSLSRLMRMVSSIRAAYQGRRDIPNLHTFAAGPRTYDNFGGVNTVTTMANRLHLSLDVNLGCI